ncbi:hypothetical protein C8J56DRAFT_897241 [Mycena floridula]|nr:hypothetical protein C8J56DRAFT_897241 [Mycena floridula]
MPTVGLCLLGQGSAVIKYRVRPHFALASFECRTWILKEQLGLNLAGSQFSRRKLVLRLEVQFILACAGVAGRSSSPETLRSSKNVSSDLVVTRYEHCSNSMRWKRDIGSRTHYSPSSQSSLHVHGLFLRCNNNNLRHKAPVVKEGLWGHVVGRFNKGNEASDTESLRSESPSRSESPLPDPGLLRLGSRSPTIDSQASIGSLRSTASGWSRPDPSAHFILLSISVIYPISSTNPPSYPGVREERRVADVSVGGGIGGCLLRRRRRERDYTIKRAYLIQRRDTLISGNLAKSRGGRKGIGNRVKWRVG